MLDARFLQDILGETGLRLSTAINDRILLTRSLAAVVEADPRFALANFDTIIRRLTQGLSGLLSLQLAPGGIISHVTDPARNRAVLGFNMLANPKQRLAAERSIRDKELVVAGPIPLRQGGTGIIARLPIFLPGRTDRADGFWGFATAVIELDSLVRETGLGTLPQGVAVAVRGRDALGAQGELCYGDPAVFAAPGATQSLVLPVGSWQIAIRRTGALPEELVRWRVWLWPLGLLLAALSAFVTFMVLRQPVVLQAAVDRATADMKEANVRAEAARQAAESANQAKTKFLSSVSHELRTPLHAIIDFGQLMQIEDSQPLGATQSGHLRQILRAGNLLLRVIGNVLDLSQAEKGQLPLSITTMAPREEIMEAVENAAAIAVERGIVVRDRTVGEALPNIYADPTRFQQILLNLLSNAIKYNRHQGGIVVAAERRPEGRLRICVTDTGQGIAADKLDRLFQHFDRLGMEAGKIEGAGIGLAVCRELVTHMHGEIGAESVAGSGSTFWFELPISEEDVVASPEKSSGEVHDLVPMRSANTADAASSAPQAGRGRSARRHLDGYQPARH